MSIQPELNRLAGQYVASAANSFSSAQVAILLCTYNGAKFLSAQLDSIERQTHPNWVVYVSDDGSSDATLKILQRYRERFGKDRLVIYTGPRQGFAKNFMSLIMNPNIQGDYFAFCDQDDIWFADKLARSLKRISNTPLDVPALYCSRTRLVDSLGQVIGFSPLFSKKPGFRNALVQSLAGANTMLLNNAARALLKQIPDDAHIVSHDWLVYLLVSGCGGVVIYDPEPTLDYRQHGANLIGSNTRLADRWIRIRKMFAGTFSEWNRHNLYALSNSYQRLTTSNRVALKLFIQVRDSSFFLRRIYSLKKAGLYRQTLCGNVGLVVAASIRRV
jgi:glycosyltransferase involved in cell wall biosynthesis